MGPLCGQRVGLFCQKDSTKLWVAASPIVFPSAIRRVRGYKVMPASCTCLTLPTSLHDTKSTLIQSFAPRYS